MIMPTWLKYLIDAIINAFKKKPNNTPVDPIDPVDPVDPKPEPPNTLDAIPFTSIKWYNDRVEGMQIDAKIHSVSIGADRRTIFWTATKPHTWYAEKNFKPCNGQTGCVDGNAHVIAEINGQWYGARFEWLAKDRDNQKCSLEWRDGDPPFIQTKTGPLNKWFPKSGDKIYFMLSSIAWQYKRPDPSGRSQIYGPVLWP